MLGPVTGALVPDIGGGGPPGGGPSGGGPPPAQPPASLLKCPHCGTHLVLMANYAEGRVRVACPRCIRNGGTALFSQFIHPYFLQQHFPSHPPLIPGPAPGHGSPYDSLDFPKPPSNSPRPHYTPDYVYRELVGPYLFGFDLGGVRPLPQVDAPSATVVEVNDNNEPASTANNADPQSHRGSVAPSNHSVARSSASSAAPDRSPASSDISNPAPAYSVDDPNDPYFVSAMDALAEMDRMHVGGVQRPDRPPRVSPERAARFTNAYGPESGAALRAHNGNNANRDDDVVSRHSRHSRAPSPSRNSVAPSVAGSTQSRRSGTSQSWHDAASTTGSTSSYSTARQSQSGRSGRSNVSSRSGLPSRTIPITHRPTITSVPGDLVSMHGTQPTPITPGNWPIPVGFEADGAPSVAGSVGGRSVRGTSVAGSAVSTPSTPRTPSIRVVPATPSNAPSEGRAPSSTGRRSRTSEASYHSAQNNRPTYTASQGDLASIAGSAIPSKTIRSTGYIEDDQMTTGTSSSWARAREDDNRSVGSSSTSKSSHRSRASGASRASHGSRGSRRGRDAGLNDSDSDGETVRGTSPIPTYANSDVPSRTPSNRVSFSPAMSEAALSHRAPSSRAPSSHRAPPSVASLAASSVSRASTSSFYRDMKAVGDVNVDGIDWNQHRAPASEAPSSASSAPSRASTSSFVRGLHAVGDVDPDQIHWNQHRAPSSVASSAHRAPSSVAPYHRAPSSARAPSVASTSSFFREARELGEVDPNDIDWDNYREPAVEDDRLTDAGASQFGGGGSVAGYSATSDASSVRGYARAGHAAYSARSASSASSVASTATARSVGSSNKHPWGYPGSDGEWEEPETPYQLPPASVSSVASIADEGPSAAQEYRDGYIAHRDRLNEVRDEMYPGWRERPLWGPK